MKRVLWGLALGFLILLSGTSWADSPIFQGFYWDTAPASAYNAKRGEFLVVWDTLNPLYQTNDPRFFGPVLGQLIKENGNKIGEPFEIISSGGVRPQVTYNDRTNEYLVVAERYFNTVGQRVSALGLRIGGLVTYLENARAPRVVYNPLALNNHKDRHEGDYLVAGAWWSYNPGCTLKIDTLNVSGTGQPIGLPTTVANEGVAADFCGDDVGFYALAYAPYSTPRAPGGRYLLAIGYPTHLKMLDSGGRVLPVLYDFEHQEYVHDRVPFQSGTVGEAYDFDIAYGLSGGQPVFFLAWVDINQYVDNYGKWTGIWGGIVEADKELYDTTEAVKNEVFPISSYQWDRQVLPDHYKHWKPVVRYNPAAGTFVVVWRETPGTDPGNLTPVNHIRVNTSAGYRIPPEKNLVVSSTIGAENPTLPAMAASSKTAALLIAWEDHRGFLGVGDIYGTMFNANTRSTSGINPGDPEEAPVFWRSITTGIYAHPGNPFRGGLWGLGR